MTLKGIQKGRCGIRSVVLLMCACFGVLLIRPIAAQQAPRGASQDKTKARGPAQAPGPQHLRTRSDEEMTRHIRQSLLGNKKLSSSARKITIVTKAQYVTLKGQVQTADEKSWVEARAAEVAGDDYVMSELSVLKPVATRTSKTKAPPVAGR